MSYGQFRWRLSDYHVGEHWSAWHELVGLCSACCCGPGPVHGEHAELIGFVDDDGYGTCHEGLNPDDLEEWDVVEYRDGGRTSP